MKYKNVISVLDEFNISNILSIIKFKSDTLILLNPYNNTSISKENVKNQFKEYNLNISIEVFDIEGLDERKIREIIEKYNNKTTIANLTVGNRYISLLLLKLCIECKIRPLYVNIDSEEIILLDTMEKIEIKDCSLEIEDFVKGSGSIVIEESTKIFEDEGIKEFTEYILHNHDKWKDVSPYFKNSNIVEQNFMIKENIKVKLGELDIGEQRKLKDVCDCISKFKLGNIEFISNKNIIINFKNCDFKSFVFKSGTWLEVLVYRVLKDMKNVEDVKGGLVFAWEKEAIEVKNEVDVIATNDSKLIYISCKDTNKYDSQALNEIQVYAEKLGGEKVTKVLVATQEPEKKTMIERANEMGINLIIFDGDINKLRNNMKNLI